MLDFNGVLSNHKGGIPIEGKNKLNVVLSMITMINVNIKQFYYIFYLTFFNSKSFKDIYSYDSPIQFMPLTGCS